MYFQYGYCRPFVNQKLGRPATIRQFVPMLFILSTAFFLLLSTYNIFFLYIALLELGLYFFIALMVSSKISFSKKNLSLIPTLIITFLGIHFSYGLGYLKGLFETFALGRSPNVTMKDTPLTR